MVHFDGFSSTTFVLVFSGFFMKRTEPVLSSYFLRGGSFIFLFLLGLGYSPRLRGVLVLDLDYFL